MMTNIDITEIIESKLNKWDYGSIIEVKITIHDKITFYLYSYYTTPHFNKK